MGFVLLQKPSAVELEVTNSWPDIFLQNFLLKSRIHQNGPPGEGERGLGLYLEESNKGCWILG